jgi:signal transduction histidine kinase
MDPLKRLRLRLTAWYVGTFTAVLALLGAGLFIVLSGQLSGDLDLKLETAVAAVRRTMDVRVAFGTAGEQALREAVAENAGPDRLLYLFDRTGKPLVAPNPVDPRIAAAAVDAINDDDAVSDEFRTSSRQRWRVYAEPILVGDAQRFGLVAVADATGFERQLTRLVQTFGAAALLAVLLVGVGGYQIARVSAASVERAMERLRTLTADAAHELRTPVSVIRGHAELALQREREAAAYSAALRHIATEAQRLGQLLDNLLTLARAEAGDRPKQRRRLFLDDLADQAVTSAAVLGAERGVGVSLGRFEETAVVADPDLVTQMLLILLDNGIKFTPSGGSVQVHVFTEHHHPTLIVEDTGIGIAPEHLPHVFERFYRGDRSRSGVPGAGLGLAIARWIAEQHDATITISSAPDRGTRVEVRFPVPPAAPSEAPVAATPTRQSGANPTDRR